MARYKLTPTDRAERLARRGAARDEKAARRRVLREWFDARREAAEKRRRQAVPRTGPRGVDRVPERYRVAAPVPEYLVEHTGPSRLRLRATSRHGRPLPRLREQRAMRLEYAVGEALRGQEFATDEGERAAVASVKRWAR